LIFSETIVFQSKTFLRRPIAFRSATIGIWFYILDVLAYLAIIANVKILSKLDKQISKFF